MKSTFLGYGTELWLLVFFIILPFFKDMGECLSFFPTVLFCFLGFVITGRLMLASAFAVSMFWTLTLGLDLLEVPDLGEPSLPVFRGIGTCRCVASASSFCSSTVRSRILSLRFAFLRAMSSAGSSSSSWSGSSIGSNWSWAMGSRRKSWRLMGRVLGEVTIFLF